MNDIQPAEELLQCYDDAGNPTESLPRSVVKQIPYRYWYGVVNIWLVNDKGEILCSKRAPHLKGNPGKWQTYVGGHVTGGLSFVENGIKEMGEEVGLTVAPDELMLIGRRRDDANKAFKEDRFVRFNGQPSDLKFADGEVTEAKWMTFEAYVKDKEENPEHWCNGINAEKYDKIMFALSL